MVTASVMRTGAVAGLLVLSAVWFRYLNQTGEACEEAVESRSEARKPWTFGSRSGRCGRLPATGVEQGFVQSRFMAKRRTAADAGVADGVMTERRGTRAR